MIELRAQYISEPQLLAVFSYSCLNIYNSTYTNVRFLPVTDTCAIIYFKHAMGINLTSHLLQCIYTGLNWCISKTTGDGMWWVVLGLNWGISMTTGGCMWWVVLGHVSGV